MTGQGWIHWLDGAQRTLYLREGSNGALLLAPLISRIDPGWLKSLSVQWVSDMDMKQIDFDRPFHEQLPCALLETAWGPTGITTERGLEAIADFLAPLSSPPSTLASSLPTGPRQRPKAMVHQFLMWVRIWKAAVAAAGFVFAMGFFVGAYIVATAAEFRPLVTLPARATPAPDELRIRMDALERKLDALLNR